MPVIRTSSPSDATPAATAPAGPGVPASADPDTPGSASDDQPQASLQERLAFSQATSLLVGLTGCSSERAADALRTTAGHLDIHPARIARLLLEHVVALDDGDSEAFVARLEDAARDAGADTRHPAGRGRDHRTARAQPSPGPAGARSRSRQLTAMPILAGDLRGVTVGGELDIATAPLLADAVTAVYRTAAAPTATSVPAFLFHLADLTFLDASGLRALAAVHDRTRARGDQLHVAAPIATAPRRLLRLAVGRGWLDPLFDVTDPHDLTDTPPAAAQQRAGRTA